MKRASAFLRTEFPSTLFGTYIFTIFVHLAYSKIKISNDFDIENFANSNKIKPQMDQFLETKGVTRFLERTEYTRSFIYEKPIYKKPRARF